MWDLLNENSFVFMERNNRDHIIPMNHINLFGKYLQINRISLNYSVEKDIVMLWFTDCKVN